LNAYNMTFSRPPDMLKEKEVAEPFKERRRQPLRSAAQAALNNYFTDLEGQQPGNLYDMMIGEVEQALFSTVMAHTRGNQSKAAEILGINRSTLRKKLRLYELLD
jgi:Fis family transcriptional regulator